LFEKTKIPPQTITAPRLDKKETAKMISSGVVASSLCGFLPGLGSAQAAILALTPFKKTTPESFLILIGAINTIVMIISFIAIYTIDKARSGSVVIISKIMGSLTFSDFIIFLIATLISAVIAFYLTKGLSLIFSKLITKVNYQKLALAIIILVTSVVLALSGPIGFIVLFISTALGIIPSLVGVGKNHMMGCLILPVILYFLL